MASPFIKEELGVTAQHTTQHSCMSCEHVAFHTAVCQGVQWTGQLPAPSETLFLVCEQLAPASSSSWESVSEGSVCLSVCAVACCRVGGSHLSRYLTNSVLWCVLLVMMAKEKPPITVVGDVGGRIAIIVVWPGTGVTLLPLSVWVSAWRWISVGPPALPYSISFKRVADLLNTYNGQN